MEIENKKTKKWKRYILISLSLFFVIVLSLFIASRYIIWRDNKNINNALEEIEKIEEDIYQQQLNDNYGGETPQETLEMYIKALESRDYELASKYFVLGEQEKNLNFLIESNQENLNSLINLLREVNKSPESLVESGKFSMRSSTELGPFFYIYFEKSINDIWKIMEM
ncbi:MAG: hypothetical protein WDZ80_05700 [Candidatus Paceibacterota bacterium]